MHPLINASHSTSKRDFVLVTRPGLLTWGVSNLEESIKRGDVVSIVSPKNPGECFLKRIIGLPNDIVKTISFKQKYVRVPPGHCWIEGDNYKSSYDSNSFGCVPLGLIIGRAQLVIYPYENLKKLDSELPLHRLIRGEHEFKLKNGACFIDFKPNKNSNKKEDFLDNKDYDDDDYDDGDDDDDEDNDPDDNDIEGDPDEDDENDKV
jgi:mitochondrial inner membrane protease subunit 2